MSRHDGAAVHRLDDHPVERSYHDAWERINERANILGLLLGDGQTEGEVTDRDRLVAATVIQWLGSPVGQVMVDDVLQEHPT